MSEPVLRYECPIAGNKHAVPGPDVRIMKVGDGGFVVACGCGPEDLEGADERPHPTVDHLVNIYAGDPSPEQWLRLERRSNGWYDTSPMDTPEDEQFSGTHGRRRENFRSKVEEIADEQEVGKFEESEQDQKAKRVACPKCGAKVGRKCKRPSGHRTKTAHSDRVEAAERTLILKAKDTCILSHLCSYGEPGEHLC